MKMSQQMDIEILVSGMVELENGDNILGAACDPEREPEFWDISVEGYPEGFDNEHYPILEVEGLISQELVNHWVSVFEHLFPDAGLTNL